MGYLPFQAHFSCSLLSLYVHWLRFDLSAPLGAGRLHHVRLALSKSFLVWPFFGGESFCLSCTDPIFGKATHAFSLPNPVCGVCSRYAFTLQRLAQFSATSAQSSSTPMWESSFHTSAL